MKSFKTVLIATAVALTGVFAAGSASAACTKTNNVRLGNSYVIGKNNGCALKSAKVRVNSPAFLAAGPRCVNFNGNRTASYLSGGGGVRVNSTYALYYGKNCGGGFFGTRTKTSN